MSEKPLPPAEDYVKSLQKLRESGDLAKVIDWIENKTAIWIKRESRGEGRLEDSAEKS